MQGSRPWIDRTELRRDRRYLMPVLDVTIGEGHYQALNWSMGGLLIDGVCHDIGSRVRGTVGLSGSREIMPFAATVVRIDPAFGSCAICFDDPSFEHLDTHDNPFVDQLH
jgi:hypothetical protein